jgi:opacity protein-like surface antigen
MTRTMAGVLVGLALCATAANAQSAAEPASFTLGFSAGLSVPGGDFSAVAKSGYNISAMVEYQAPTLPVAFRGEAQWQQFGIKGGTGSYKVLTALANVVYPFRTSGVVTPYATGGLGAASIPFNGKRGVRFAYDLGAGAQFQVRDVSSFVEVNWQSIEASGASLRQFPIRVGVRLSPSFDF